MMPAITTFGAIAAGTVAIALSIAVAILLGSAAEERDLAARVRTVMRPPTEGQSATGVLAARTANLFAELGERLRSNALFAEGDLASLERTVAAAGFDPRRTASVFIGVKVVLLLLCPLLGYAYGAFTHQRLLIRIGIVAAGLVLGMLGPNIALGFMRRSLLATLRRGLPDALDLMVVCGEAGLGLESAVGRIAREMEASSPATAREFATLSRELRILPNRREALVRMGERTGVEGYRRLGASLSQALRYGTPLSQALRVLAVEMRQERMLRMEEKAARLPALLVMPLILFIMPSLFIVLIGPSMLQLLGTLGEGR